MVSASLVNLKIVDTNFSLKCMPSERNFNYLWERKDIILPSRAKGIHTSHMTISKLMPEDSGEYRCIMSNSTGTISSKYFKVVIQGTFILHSM